MLNTSGLIGSDSFLSPKESMKRKLMGPSCNVKYSQKKTSLVFWVFFVGVEKRNGICSKNTLAVI